MKGENIQPWDDVADLPWAESLAMYPLPDPPAPCVRRRVVDDRPLAEVVRAVAGTP